jgi:hypothetical protein
MDLTRFVGLVGGEKGMELKGLVKRVNHDASSGKYSFMLADGTWMSAFKHDDTPREAVERLESVREGMRIVCEVTESKKVNPKTNKPYLNIVKMGEPELNTKDELAPPPTVQSSGQEKTSEKSDVLPGGHQPFRTPEQLGRESAAANMAQIFSSRDDPEKPTNPTAIANWIVEGAKVISDWTISGKLPDQEEAPF